MEKKFTKYTRKALSALMALIMVFSMFVFSPEMFKKAEAATAGNYYVKITWKVTNRKGDALFEGDNMDNDYKGTGSVNLNTDKNNCVGMSLFYTADNGQSSTVTKEAYWDIGKSNTMGGATNMSIDGHISSSTGTTRTATATISGFPTSFFGITDGQGASTIAWEVTKIEVGASSSGPLTTIWSGTGHAESSNQQYYFNIYPDSDSGNNKNYGYVSTNTPRVWTSNMPTQKSVTWTTTPDINIKVPKEGKNEATTVAGATVYDQYGVEWYQEPNYALSTSATATSTNTAMAGISRTTTAADQCTIGVTNEAKDYLGAGTDKKVIYVSAYSGNAVAQNTTKVIIENVKYKFSINANGGQLASGTADQEKYYGYTYGINPSATRTGYTFKGFYSTKYADSFATANYPSAGTTLASGTQITSDTTWYAAWQANMYKATFLRKTSNTTTETYAEQDVYMDQLPTVPSGTPAAYDEGDYHYTFSGWPTLTKMTQNGEVYTANYSPAFVAADYTALETAIAQAQAKVAEADYEAEYSEITRKALTRVLDDAVAFDTAAHVGRTQQALVNTKTTALLNAIAALEPAEYSVLYINKLNDAIIKVDFPVVNNSAISYPADPEITSAGVDGHYVFKEWVPASDAYDMSKVKTNMVIYADFDLVSHNFTTETIPSNCTSEGRTVYTCSDCGYSYEELNGVMGDHVWKTEWTEDVPATCTTAGSKSIHCEVCGAKKNITELSALGHDYFGAEVETILEAGCESQGATAKICNRCGYKLVSLTEAGSHEYTSVVTEPTCTSNGYTTDTCSKCGDVVIKDFTPLKAHTYTEDTSKTVEATCTNNGIKYSYCTCGAEKVETTPALSHTWGEATTDFEATCENAGQKSVKCAECGVVDEDSIEVITALDHDYAAEWSVLVPATCTGKGTKVKECSRCNAKLVEEIPALTHNFNTEAEVLVEATCGTNSVKKYACANNCGEYIIEVGTENYTHTYGEWVVTPATCTAEGSKTRTCSRCGDVETDVVSMTAHSYTDTTPIAATCTMPAGTTYKCATCDSTYTVYSGDANGHDLSYTVDGGKVTISCANCDFEETFDAELPVDGGHNWTKISETAATCKAEGEIVFGCTDDGCTVENVTVTVPVNEEAHDISTVVTEAGCETAGKVVTSCSRCDFSEEIALAAKGHTFTFPGTVTKAATCSEDGIITFECADCDKTETQTVPAIGHTYEATAETAEATCSAPAYTVYKCSTCDAKVNVTTGNADPTKHNFVVTTEVSGNATTVTVECSLCGAKKTEDIDAPHHYTSAEIITPSACNVEGLVRVYCGDTDCDYYIDINLPTTDHNFVAAYTAPTCSLDGSIRFFCSACGAEDEASAQVLPAIGHTWGTTVTDHKDATCTEDGYDEYTCVRCTETHKETIAKTGHTWLENTDRYEAPTCTADGKKVYECSSCDAEVEIAVSFDANTIHSYEVTSVPATCATAGYDKYVCAACGDVIYKNIVPATNNHTFVISEIEATCTSKSGKHFECSVCGLSYDVLDGEYAPHPWATDWTIEKEPTCTEYGEKAIYCTACGERGVSALIAKLGHDVDGTTPVDVGAGDGFMWYTYDCSRCHGYKSVKLDVIAKSTSGAVIKDARFVLYNSNGDMVSKGVAEGDGRYYTEKSLLRPGAYVLTIFADDAHYSASALVVSPEGNVSGSITGVDLSTCGHICHGDNFIAKIIRSICTFFSAIFNRTIKCCDDMEWYGKYADQIKH